MRIEIQQQNNAHIRKVLIDVLLLHQIIIVFFTNCELKSK